MTFIKWHHIWRKPGWEPTDFAKSQSYNKLLQTITNKEKTSIQSDFSRNKKKLSDPNDVASYIDDYYKKDVKKNPDKYY